MAKKSKDSELDILPWLRVDATRPPTTEGFSYTAPPRQESFAPPAPVVVPRPAPPPAPVVEVLPRVVVTPAPAPVIAPLLPLVPIVTIVGEMVDYVVEKFRKPDPTESMPVLIPPVELEVLPEVEVIASPLPPPPPPTAPPSTPSGDEQPPNWEDIARGNEFDPFREPITPRQPIVPVLDPLQPGPSDVVPGTPGDFDPFGDDPGVDDEPASVEAPPTGAPTIELPVTPLPFPAPGGVGDPDAFEDQPAIGPEPVATPRPVVAPNPFFDPTPNPFQEPLPSPLEPGTQMAPTPLPGRPSESPISPDLDVDLQPVLAPVMDPRPATPTDPHIETPRIDSPRPRPQQPGPGGAPSRDPEMDAELDPLLFAQPDPLKKPPCSCKDETEAKPKKKRKPRQECWKGTYTQKSFGVHYAPLRKVKCN